ncbi:hypothetical protein E2320_022674, partial [Naja naja]
LHMVQILINCDLQGDGSKTGFALMAYNGESMGPPSTMDKSDMEECSALLEKFLSYGNETLLRTDGTYHYWLSIQIDPEERGHYRCHVEHDGLQESLDMALKGEGGRWERLGSLAGWRIVGEKFDPSCVQM